MSWAYDGTQGSHLMADQSARLAVKPSGLWSWCRSSPSFSREEGAEVVRLKFLGSILSLSCGRPYSS